MTASHSNYDPVARAYDRFWGNDFNRKVPALERLFLPRVAEGSEVLDLCCGTGQLAEALIGRGYRVVGLDGSCFQLAFARVNAPSAELLHADARSFSIPLRFDGVVSLYESLNHIMTLPELTSVFRNVFDSLCKGGVFVFDMNTAHKYETAWSGTNSFVEDDLVVVARANAFIEHREAELDLVVFERLDEERWCRSDVTLRQTWYADDDIRDALKQAGFSNVEIHSFDEDKTFFVAT